MHGVYMGGNVALNGLNAMWAVKMIRAMGRRLRGVRKGEEVVTNGRANGKKTR